MQTSHHQVPRPPPHWPQGGAVPRRQAGNASGMCVGIGGHGQGGAEGELEVPVRWLSEPGVGVCRVGGACPELPPWCSATVCVCMWWCDSVFRILERRAGHPACAPLPPPSSPPLASRVQDTGCGPQPQGSIPEVSFRARQAPQTWRLELPAALKGCSHCSFLSDRPPPRASPTFSPPPTPSSPNYHQPDAQPYLWPPALTPSYILGQVEGTGL